MNKLPICHLYRGSFRQTRLSTSYLVSRGNFIAYFSWKAFIRIHIPQPLQHYTIQPVNHRRGIVPWILNMGETWKSCTESEMGIAAKRRNLNSFTWLLFVKFILSLEYCDFVTLTFVFFYISRITQNGHTRFAFSHLKSRQITLSFSLMPRRTHRRQP